MTQQLSPDVTSTTTTRRARRVLSHAGRALLVLLGVIVAPVAGAAALWAAASVTDSLALVATAGLVALAATCALLVYAGVRRRVVTAVVTAAMVAGTVALASVTLLLPMDQTLPTPQSEPTGYWTLQTGSRLAYTQLPAEGEPRPSPVIVLHGGPGTPGDGADEVDRLVAAQGYDVYVYDQLGSGRSARLDDPTGYTVARQVADLEAVRAEIGADRVVLMGASWGATLAAEYTAEYPEHVAGLVLTSPGVIWAPAWADREEGDIWDRLTPDQERRIDELEASPRLLAWSLLLETNPRAAHALVGDAEIDAVFAELLAIAAPAASCHPDRPLEEIPQSVPGFYANQLTTADQLTVPDPRPALRDVRVPAIVLRGDCDYKDPGIAREYEEVLPGATLVTVPGAGHLIDAEQPDTYRRAVLEFLDGIG